MLAPFGFCASSWSGSTTVVCNYNRAKSTFLAALGKGRNEATGEGGGRASPHKRGTHEMQGLLCSTHWKEDLAMSLQGLGKFLSLTREVTSQFAAHVLCRLG